MSPENQEDKTMKVMITCFWASIFHVTDRWCVFGIYHCAAGVNGTARLTFKDKTLAICFHFWTPSDCLPFWRELSETAQTLIFNYTHIYTEWCVSCPHCRFTQPLSDCRVRWLHRVMFCSAYHRHVRISGVFSPSRIQRLCSRGNSHENKQTPKYFGSLQLFKMITDFLQILIMTSSQHMFSQSSYSFMWVEHEYSCQSK